MMLQLKAINNNRSRYSDCGNNQNTVDRKRYKAALRGVVYEVVILVFIMFLVFRFLFGITVQHGNDMYPALKDGDIVVYYRTSDLMNTEACVYIAGGKIRTGRIAAAAGEEISSTSDMRLTINGRYLPALPSSGIYDRTYASENENLPLTVEDGCCFILGDNRENAEDSRSLGPVKCANICGRIIAVFRRRQI